MKKFKFLRPISLKVQKGEAKQWWKFAFECIKRGIRAKNGSLKEFMICNGTMDLY